jgi:DNA-binding NarL/FixJ family response regulator
VRVTIAEDSVLLQEGLSLLLSTAGHQVTAVGTVAEFLASVDRRPPDVAVVDVRLPPTFRDEGVRAALDARRRHRGLPVLVLSQYVERTYAAELISDGLGAVGYLLKDRVSRVDDFLEALTRVAAGGTAMDPGVIGQLLAGPATDPLARLTPRERQVLSLMAEGHTNANIATQLGVTQRAISKHINNIFTKLGLLDTGNGNRRVLAVLAYLSGIGPTHPAGSASTKLTFVRDGAGLPPGRLSAE